MMNTHTKSFQQILPAQKRIKKIIYNYHFGIVAEIQG